MENHKKVDMEYKHLDRIISFHKKERRKMKKVGRRKEAVKHSLTIDLMYELKRGLIN